MCPNKMSDIRKFIKKKLKGDAHGIDCHTTNYINTEGDQQIQTHNLASTNISIMKEIESSKRNEDLDAGMEIAGPRVDSELEIEYFKPDGPTCWTEKQKFYYCDKNPWITLEGEFLGCSLCKNAESLNITYKVGTKYSFEWTKNLISHSGDTTRKQCKSLTEKINDHKKTEMHIHAQKSIEDLDKKPLQAVFEVALSRELETTERIFRTVYKMVKSCQSFYTFTNEIDLQQINGLDMGTILHSTNSAINIAYHIGKEMRKNVCRTLTQADMRFSILIDESTTFSKKSTLIIYIRIILLDADILKPINLFLDLIELSSLNALSIFNSLLLCLENHGFTRDVLKRRLIAITCDGAAVLMGKNNGVIKLFEEVCPSLIVWHCANHRLELAVRDSIKAVAGIDRFKRFIDKIYALYSASPKNARDLSECAKSLNIQLIKIGRLLSTRWVASSFRTAEAVWNDYEALVLHFQHSKVSTGRTRKEKHLYAELDDYICSSEFLLDLGLICDALIELKEVSLKLQDRNINLNEANTHILILAKVFSDRITSHGKYYTDAMDAVKLQRFRGVDIKPLDTNEIPPINPQEFYISLKNSIEIRLLNEKNTNLIKLSEFLDTKFEDELFTDITSFDNNMEELGIIFKLDQRTLINGLREYRVTRKMPPSIEKLKAIISTIPISSSECERGFSQMNLIASSLRSSFLVSSISVLLYIKLVGPSLNQFDPSAYVRSWLVLKKRTATDSRSKVRNMEKNFKDIEDSQHLWDSLKRLDRHI